MAQVAESTASLRIMGEDLDHEEITALLGATPTQGERNGDRIVGAVSGSVRISKGGMWRLESERHRPENFDGQVAGILAKLSTDLEVWRAISSKYYVEIYSGLFLDVSNEGFSISAKTLDALAKRGIEIQFDIYGAVPERDEGPA